MVKSTKNDKVKARKARKRMLAMIKEGKEESTELDIVSTELVKTDMAENTVCDI